MDDYATAEGAKQLARYVQLKYGTVVSVAGVQGGRMCGAQQGRKPCLPPLQALR